MDSWDCRELVEIWNWVVVVAGGMFDQLISIILDELVIVETEDRKFVISVGNWQFFDNSIFDTSTTNPEPVKNYYYNNE